MLNNTADENNIKIARLVDVSVTYRCCSVSRDRKLRRKELCVWKIDRGEASRYSRAADPREKRWSSQQGW